MTFRTLATLVQKRTESKSWYLHGDYTTLNGMNFRDSSGSHVPLYFQVTALVDILMVLLVFFLYNYATGQDEGQLKITVPSAKNVDQTPVSAPVFINVQKDGNIVVNGRSFTETELGNLLTEVIQNNPQQTVLLRADKDVAYERILRVLDICQGANVEGVGFSATQTPSSQ